MRRKLARWFGALAAGFGVVATSPRAGAENLGQAWSIALGVNQGLQAQQSQTVAEGFNLEAARRARLPTLRTFSFETFLTATPAIRNSLFGTSSTGGSAAGVGGIPGQPGLAAPGAAVAGTGALAGLPSAFPILGAGQRQLPVSITFASIPIYTGGRISRTVDAANAMVTAQRTEESRTVLDLKLIVAEAYVGVLRSQRNLDVARSNVSRLDSFARDVRNRREQGMAIRSDELAAEVSLANARLSEIQARTALDSAWATYNRYLCRPLNATVPLDELSDLSQPADWRELAAQAVRSASPGDEAEALDLANRAFRNRPELAGLSAQARGLGAQADATLAGIKPQVSFVVANAFVGNQAQVPQDIGAATFIADWTITDGGVSRRRAASFRQQEFAALKRRADLAADIALQVRTRWLDLRQSRQRVPVSRLAIAQAEENINTVTDRYRQQLSNYTEVLDSENRRVQSYTNFYNAVYDESLALFRLRRAVGDL